MCHKLKIVFYVNIIAALLFTLCQTQAARAEFTPSLTVGERYDSNIYSVREKVKVRM